MFSFTSSAIESISDVQDGQVSITFAGGRTYTYGVSDVERFTSALTSVINDQRSVGQFVNRAIRQDQLLEQIAA
jgi:hypothetical protein